MRLGMPASAKLLADPVSVKGELSESCFMGGGEPWLGPAGSGGWTANGAAECRALRAFVRRLERSRPVTRGPSGLAARSRLAQRRSGRPYSQQRWQTCS